MIVAKKQLGSNHKRSISGETVIGNLPTKAKLNKRQPNEKKIYNAEEGLSDNCAQDKNNSQPKLLMNAGPDENKS